jgi:hypothetical protein
MVTMAKGAKSFHRAGRLRFNFQKVELPAEIANLKPSAPAPEPSALTTQATLADAEGSGSAPIKVDSEGGVQAQESKTRFIAPMISLLLASKSADNDAERHGAGGVGGPNAARWEARRDSDWWAWRSRRARRMWEWRSDITGWHGPFIRM